MSSTQEQRTAEDQRSRKRTSRRRQNRGPQPATPTRRRGPNRRLIFLIIMTTLVIALVIGLIAWRVVNYERETKALRQQAFAAFAETDYPKAFELLTRYLKREPEDATALIRLAQVQMQLAANDRSQLIRVVPTLEAALQHNPGPSEEHVAKKMLMQVYMIVGPAEEAETLARELFNSNPRDVVAFDALMRLLLAKNQFDEVVARSTNILAQEVLPEELRDVALLMKARGLAGQSKFIDAMFWTEEALKVAPANLAAQQMYLNLAQQLNKPASEFVRYAERLHNEKPDVVMNQVMYASACRVASQHAARNGDLETSQQFERRALDLIRKATEGETSSYELRLLLSELENLDAKEDIDKLLAGQSGREDAPWVRQEFCRRALIVGNPQDALARLKDLDGESPEATAELIALKVLALMRTDQKDQIPPLLAALRERQTDDEAARGWLAFLGSSGVEGVDPLAPTEQMAAFEKAIAATSPPPPFLLVGYGELLNQKGAHAKARTVWSTAATAAPYWGAPLTALSRSLLRDGDASAALEAAQSSVKRQGTIAAVSAFADAAAASAAEWSLERREKITDQFKSFLAQSKDWEQVASLVTAYIRMHAMAERTDEAKAQIDKLLESNTDLAPDFLLNLATISMQYDLGYADRLLKMVEAKHGMSPALATVKARRLAATEGFEQALAFFKEARGLVSDDNPLAWDMQYVSLVGGTGAARFRDEFAAISDTYADNVAVQEALAHTNVVRNDAALFETVVERLDQASGSMAEFARLNKAVWTLERSRDVGERREAMGAFIKFMRENPKYPPDEARLLLADVLAVAGEGAREIEQLATLMKGSTASANVAIRLSQRLNALGRPDSARSLINQFLDQRNTDRVNTVMALAQHLQSLGESDRAIELLLELDSEDPRPKLLLANLYLTREEKAKAAAIADEIVASGNESLLMTAALIHTVAGNQERADEIIASRGTDAEDRWKRHLELAEFYRRLGNTEKVTVHLRAATQVDPKRAELWRALVTHQLQTKQIDEAVTDARTAQNATGQADLFRQLIDNAEMLKTLGETYRLPTSMLVPLVDEDQEAADAFVTALKALSKLDPTKNPDDVLAVLRGLAERNPRDFTLQMLTLYAMPHTGATQELVTEAERLSLLFRGSPVPPQVAAQTLAARGVHGQALRFARIWRSRLIDTTPADALVLDLAWRLKDPGVAAAELRIYLDRIESDPKANPDLTMAVARLMVIAGEADRADEMLAPLMKESSDWTRRYVQLASLMADDDLRDFERWLRNAERFGKQDQPGQIMAYHASAWFGIHTKMEDSDAGVNRAVELSEQAMEAGYVMPESLVLHAMAEYTLKNVESAEKLYRRALEMDLKQWMAHNNLAMLILEHKGPAEEAIHHAQAATRLRPRAATTHDTLASAYRYAGKLDDALKAIKTAVATAPYGLEWHVGHAEILMKLGREDEARDVVERIEKLKSDYNTLEEGPAKRLATLREKLGLPVADSSD